ncbi:MAG: hypothetical protein GY754_41970 [bacterium]|nr:hypothetical protein [bacterium]
MESKLTLKLDKDVVEQAKLYAQQKNISLSKMVERYFKSLIEEKSMMNKKYTPLVKELSGIIKLDDDDDNREEYTDFLIEKYK